MTAVPCVKPKKKYPSHRLNSFPPSSFSPFFSASYIFSFKSRLVALDLYFLIENFRTFPAHLLFLSHSSHSSHSSSFSHFSTVGNTSLIRYLQVCLDRFVLLFTSDFRFFFFFYFPCFFIASYMKCVGCLFLFLVLADLAQPSRVA